MVLSPAELVLHSPINYAKLEDFSFALSQALARLFKLISVTLFFLNRPTELNWDPLTLSTAEAAQQG